MSRKHYIQSGQKGYLTSLKRTGIFFAMFFLLYNMFSALPVRATELYPNCVWYSPTEELTMSPTEWKEYTFGAITDISSDTYPGENVFFNFYVKDLTDVLLCSVLDVPYNTYLTRDNYYAIFPADLSSCDFSEGQFRVWVEAYISGYSAGTTSNTGVLTSYVAPPPNCPDYFCDPAETSFNCPWDCPITYPTTPTDDSDIATASTDTGEQMKKNGIDAIKIGIPYIAILICISIVIFYLIKKFRRL